MNWVRKIFRFKLIAILVFIIAYTTNAKGQEVYGTTNGTIYLTGVWKDSVITAISTKLGVILNYETAEFKLRLDKSTLKTGNDSLDNILGSYVKDWIELEGKLKIDYIKTQSHPPEDFKIDIFLPASPIASTITGEGHLVHILTDKYSCILSLSFRINRKINHIQIDLPGLRDEIYVEIVQSVLKREGE